MAMQYALTDSIKWENDTTNKKYIQAHRESEMEKRNKLKNEEREKEEKRHIVRVTDVSSARHSTAQPTQSHAHN